MKLNLIIIWILIISGFFVSGVSAAVLSVSPVTIQPGGTGSVILSLDSVPAGLSGYQVKVSSDNQAVVNITGVSFPDWASLSEATPGDGGLYNLKGIDLNSKVESGATNVTLAIITFSATGTGKAQIIIKDPQIDDDSGNAIQSELNPGQIEVQGASGPTVQPTQAPPTQSPTVQPTQAPPTQSPTVQPTQAPPTQSPTVQPTQVPPTQSPTVQPTQVPPTQLPNGQPTQAPPTQSPTVQPTQVPPTQSPTVQPTQVPPTQLPNGQPTQAPPTQIPGPVTGEIHISLKPGWNLINIPMQPNQGSNTAGIFKNVQNAGHSVLTYDGIMGWISLGNNDIINPMTGYWIYSTQPQTIPMQVSGNPVSARSVVIGWNLAGISGRDPKPAETALQTLSGWTQLIGFDSVNQQYKEAIIRGSPNAQTPLSPDEGFWIFLNSPGQLLP